MLTSESLSQFLNEWLKIGYVGNSNQSDVNLIDISPNALQSFIQNLAPALNAYRDELESQKLSSVGVAT